MLLATECKSPNVWLSKMEWKSFHSWRRNCFKKTQHSWLCLTECLAVMEVSLTSKKFSCVSYFCFLTHSLFLSTWNAGHSVQFLHLTHTQSTGMSPDWFEFEPGPLGVWNTVRGMSARSPQPLCFVTVSFSVHCWVGQVLDHSWETLRINNNNIHLSCAHQRPEYSHIHIKPKQCSVCMLITILLIYIKFFVFCFFWTHTHTL